MSRWRVAVSFSPVFSDEDLLVWHSSDDSNGSQNSDLPRLRGVRIGLNMRVCVCVCHTLFLRVLQRFSSFSCKQGGVRSGSRESTVLLPTKTAVDIP